ncbi:hypothetical protein HYV79_02675 [Candidatus Woesearchaeota archaeon]|nr:hypothetical protein [Candidatus Woesearchaeota archaeon]
MVVQRVISSRRYLLAGVITLLIFSLGLTLGFLFDFARTKMLEQKNQIQELDYKSLQLQYLMLSSFESTNKTCDLLRLTLDDSIKSLHQSLEKLTSYKEQTNINSEQYSILHRQYVQDNIQYWQFVLKTKEKCSFDVVPILYFFSSDLCEACPDQGVILTYFKKIFGDKVLVFPLDIDLEEKEHLLLLLRSSYGVTEYPALIIENLVLQGKVVPKNELQLIICSFFKQDQPECYEE